MRKLITKLYNFIKWRLIEQPRVRYFSYKTFKGLKNKDFTIIANNCAAGFIYQDAGLEYRTPTVGLFFHSDCYIKFIKDLSVLHLPLRFVPVSKYPYRNSIREFYKLDYPIGIIGDDIEIHFLHFHSEEEVREKWERRIKKINYDNLLFLYTVRELATDEHVTEFMNSPYKNKLCLSAKDYKGYDNLVYFPEYKELGEMPGADIARINVMKRVNFAALLNKMIN